MRGARPAQQQAHPAWADEEKAEGVTAKCYLELLGGKSKESSLSAGTRVFHCFVQVIKLKLPREEAWGLWEGPT